MRISMELLSVRGITIIGILLPSTFICSLYLLERDGLFFVYGHFFGENITRDGYQVVFQPFPFAPVAGENTTLNFSILDEENLNIHNIFSALIIKEKESNQTVEQIPYKQYLYSDITFPYKFSNNSDYLITLETRVIGDPKYQTQPLIATFNLVVGDQTSEYFKSIMIYFITPACVAIIVAILVYELYWKKNKMGKENDKMKF
jgi:hypothetical protein